MSSSDASLGRRLHQLFEVSLLLKGVFASVELLSGIALYFVDTSQTLALVQQLTLHEISEDPGDVVARFLLDLAGAFSVQTQHFYAFYLASHGIVKLAMVLALARRVVWAYPASIAVLLAFIGYQVYRYTFAPSWGLIALTLFDLVVIGLVWREYRALTDHRAFR